ncbi:hypothetical protein [Chryseobacterium gambrini]|uniref:hypothetical protein n=1 Tax=Chryseobacterium gambrini TaxID=373672 RepID=UPI0022F15D7A|nr:hypothetical protein [Chryseobacterium gambrini]WBV54308.1 hypothetical protein PFY09_08285 [Chryseobacterium gambrini]
MIDLLFGLVGTFIRWIFIYKCNSKKMAESYNSNTTQEGIKNNLAGLLLIPISIVIGLIMYYLGKE